MNHIFITSLPEVGAENTILEMIHAQPLKDPVGAKTPIIVFFRI